MSIMVEKIAICKRYAEIYQHQRPIVAPDTMTTQGVDNDPDVDLHNLYTTVQTFLDKAMGYLKPGETGIVTD